MRRSFWPVLQECICEYSTKKKTLNMQILPFHDRQHVQQYNDLTAWPESRDSVIFSSHQPTVSSFSLPSAGTPRITDGRFKNYIWMNRYTLEIQQHNIVLFWTWLVQTRSAITAFKFNTLNTIIWSSGFMVCLLQQVFYCKNVCVAIIITTG